MTRWRTVGLISLQPRISHPAGGFAYGVINSKVYIIGGRDAQ